MAQITISATGSVTVDGLLVEQTATYIADVRSFIRLTRDVDDTYAVVSGATFIVALVENVGNDNILVGWETVAGKFMSTGLAPGAHCFITARGGDDADGLAVGTTLWARSVTNAGSRIVASIGTNSNNE